MEAFHAEYKRDMQNSYLLLQTEHIVENTYRISMLLNNRIEGILPMEVRSVDDRNVCYYDISSKQSFACLYEKKTLDHMALKRMVRELIDTVNRGKEYLLDENDFVLAPEYLYMSIPDFGLQLCYLPDYHHDMRIQLSGLFEVLMNKVDYKDEKAVLLVYSLYMATKEADCTFDALLELLRTQGNTEADTVKREESVKSEVKEIAEPPEFSFKTRRKEPSVRLNGQENLYRRPNPLFLSDSGRKKYRLCGTAGVVFALFLLIYLAREWGSGGVEPMRLFVAGSMMIVGIAVAVYCFLLAAGRRQVNISPIRFENEDREAKQDVAVLKQRQGKDLDRERSLRKTEHLNTLKQIELVERGEKIEFAEKKPVEKNLVEKNPVGNKFVGKMPALEEEKTILLTDFTKREHYLTPAERRTDEKYMINELPYYIGKWKEQVNFVIEDQAVSRIHAKIMKDGEEYYLVDLNSTNGTFLNRERLEPNEVRKLSIDDEIGFAGKKYRFLES